MKKLSYEQIKTAVKEGIIRANCCLPENVKVNLKKAQTSEQGKLGQKVMAEIVRNFELAEARMEPICQDLSFTVVVL